MSTLKFLSFKATKLENNIIYITFSRTEYLKYVNNKNVLYFFDIPHDVNEENINALIEKNLFLKLKNIVMNSIHYLLNIYINIS